MTERVFSKTLRVVLVSVLCMGVDNWAHQTDGGSSSVTRPATSTVSGTVRSSEGRPLWAATVAIRSQDTVFTRTTVTDPEGRFAFVGVPPGKFFVRALKTGYLAGDYGSAGYGKPPQAVALLAGTDFTDATISMIRGGAIAGQVLDRGLPAAGITLVGVTKQFLNGQMRYVSGGVTRTDDAGFYRLFGLAPGRYAVVASLRDMTSERAPTERSADEEMMASAPQRDQLLQVRPQLPASASSYLNVFFPGTNDISAVKWLDLGLGEQKTDIGFTLPLTKAVAVTGDVRSEDGTRVRNVRVSIHASSENLSLGSGDFTTRSVSSVDGQFVFDGIQPGLFTVVASHGDPASRLVATSQVRVSGAAPPRVILNLGPAVEVSGNVVFESHSTRLPDPSTARVVLRAVGDANEEGVGITAQPQPNGSFSFATVAPGAYLFDGLLAGPSPRLSDWRIKSVVAGNRNLREGRIQIAPGQQLRDVRVVFTDATSELGGRLLGSAATFQGYVLLFATEPSQWWTGSGRMRAPIRPATDGTFNFVRLPPGSYYLALVNDFEPASWFDRSFLQQLIPAAVTVELKEGEKKTHDVQLR